MKVIGLCGGSGSGKGTVSSLFCDLGIPSIDTDALYHEMTDRDSQCLRALSSEFGCEIVKADGSLDRARLASIVFTGSEAENRRRRLNEIAHSFILAETRALIKDYETRNFPAVLIDAPLLFESGFDSECDEIICVIADEKIRISRIVSRDNISVDIATSRIRSQMSDDELIKKCDYVIYNNSNIESLISQITEIKNKFLEY